MNANCFGIYLHWPFCKIKCPYCDFNSYKRTATEDEDWLNGYLNSIDFWAIKIGKRNVNSIFFGGGTPSLLNPRTIEKILNRIDFHWGIDNSCEISLEANPNCIQIKNTKILKKVGVNRMSVGVQALNDYDLKILGRDHNKTQALKAVKIVSKNFDNFNLDFIYGRQFQKVSNWEQELLEIIKLNSPHLSFYQLNIEENSCLFKLLEKDLLRGLPDDNLASKMFDVTNKICADNAYKRYESSSFSKRNFKCKHNLTYWKYLDYIGIGPGAHGRVTLEGKKFRTEEEKNPDLWLSTKSKKQNNSPKIEVISERVLMEEKLIMNLKIYKKIPTSIFDNSKILNVIDTLVFYGLIKVQDNHLFIRRKGEKMIDYVTRSLISCF
ncbi:radical SAM family heme chaperone HemW [Paracoccaceae bacterium]|nr:radical SAM family heme chaperone HemW [Paracoccaceae bacterium]